MGSLAGKASSPGLFPPWSKRVFGIVLLLGLAVGINAVRGGVSVCHLVVLFLDMAVGVVVFVVTVRHGPRDVPLGRLSGVRHPGSTLYTQARLWQKACLGNDGAAMQGPGCFLPAGPGFTREAGIPAGMGVRGGGGRTAETSCTGPPWWYLTRNDWHCKAPSAGARLAALLAGQIQKTGEGAQPRWEALCAWRVRPWQASNLGRGGGGGTGERGTAWQLR